MSPLFLVVLLTIAATPSLADVKHVLEGSAHPPECKCKETQYHHSPVASTQHSSSFATSGSYGGGFSPAPNPQGGAGFAGGYNPAPNPQGGAGFAGGYNPVPSPPGGANFGPAYGGVPSPGGANNVVPGSVAFWWADSNSPFKHAYEYFKKCSVKGNCFPPVAPGFQVPNALPTLPPQDCGPTGVCRIIGTIDVKPLHPVPTPSAASVFGAVDIKKNPFLTGQIDGVGRGSASIGGGHTTGHVDLNANRFAQQGGQTAFSGVGQTVATGSDGFLGVQPGVPFGKTTSPSQPFPTAYPSGGVGVAGQGFPAHQGAQPFPTGRPNQPGGQTYPGQGGKFENCEQPGYACVAAEVCVNGVVRNQAVLDSRNSVGYCESGKEVCCRLPEGSVNQLGSSSSHSSFQSSVTTSGFASSSYGSTPGFSNLSDITVGKSSIPGSSYKFPGNAGLSPGVIQVVSDDNVPNPLVTSAGETGNGQIYGGSLVTNKVVRNTTPSPNSVFSSTVDYSNDKLDQLSFVSRTNGPQYLPPVSTPVPSSHIPELDLPISTYQPSIPTTRPFVTRPVTPGPSIVSVYTPKPYSPSSPKPFVPNYSEPQQPQPQNPIPSYTAFPPKPTASNEYLPPRPSSPSPFASPSQPPVSYSPFPTRPNNQVTYTHPPLTHRPTPSYIPPVQTPAKPYVPPYNPSTYKPSPTPQATYTHPVTQPTGGYSYPTPTPSFGYPTPTQPPLKPQETVTGNKYYVPPKTAPPQPTPGYQYPTPSPPFEYSRPTSPRPSLIPSSSININNQYVPPKQPTPTSGYKYPTPTPPFTYPKVTPPKPYYPPPQPHPQPTPGYSYPTPTPSFIYPSPSAPPKVSVTPPPYRPPNNEYLPIEKVPDASINQGYYKVPPTQAPTYIPPYVDAGNVNVPSIVSFPHPPEVFVGCAAALRCVQETYCTADGFISQSPVVLTRDQEYLRVPTTDCHDKETGVVGKCCRDPNYVDPWPSANLINGFDNGQYREDSSLGQYFPQKHRPARSETSGNVQNLVGDGVKYQQAQQFNAQPQQQFEAPPSNDESCGVRHANTQPRSAGPIDVGFGEIPWQAMVLRDTNRSLLCGGVIVKSNAVLTAAHCVEGLATSDVLIKGGEWKLGIDEEPLPFQIVKVAAIVRHPGYQAGSFHNDLALLMLQEKLRFAKNVAPICLPPPNQPPNGQCVATGWGKQILQVHLRGAIMRSIDVNLLDSNQCSETLANRFQHALPNYAPNTVCGYSNNDQCDVDYGSALACTNGNGQYTLAGIFSWDTGCKDESQIGGYVPPDVEWIESTCSKPLTHLKALDRQYRNQ